MQEMQIKMYGLPHSKGQSAYRLKLSAPIVAISGFVDQKSLEHSPSEQESSLNLPITSDPPPTTESTTTTTSVSSLSSSPPNPTDHQTHQARHSTFDSHAATPGRFYLPQLTSLRQHLHNALYMLNNPPQPSSPLLKPSCSPDPITTTSLAERTISYLNHLLNEILSAKSALTAPPPTSTFPYTSTPAHIFDPSLPPNFAFDLTVHEGALVVELRTLDFITSHDHDVSASVKRLFSHALSFSTIGVGGGVHRPGLYEEIGKVFTWDGKGQARVKDKVRVESQDPKLMAVMVKVGALEHAIRDATVRVEIVREVCAGIEVGGEEDMKGGTIEETHREAQGLTPGWKGAIAPGVAGSVGTGMVAAA